MIITHKRYLPSYGLMLGRLDQVCIYTMLSINEQVRDCAAYEAIGPDMSSDVRHNDTQREAMIERMEAGGNKISEAKARSMFDEIEYMELRYRP